MKTNLQSIFRVALGLLTLLLITNHQRSAFAQGTTFSYEGRLNNNNGPVNAPHDFIFTLYDSLTGPGTVGSPQSKANVPVNNGLFTVSLDFGAVFPGADRYLEIATRPAGSGSYVTLSPRQQILPTPYAITAENVISGGLAGGSYNNAVNFNNPSNRFCGDGSCLTGITLGGFMPGDFWQLNGNIINPSNFLGTLNNMPLEIRVNNTHALRIVPAPVPSLEGGFSGNSTHGSSGAAIVGGGVSGFANQVFGDYGFIGGGSGNQTEGYGVIVGGGHNIASQFSFVGSGFGNNNSSDYSFIGAGTNNYVAPFVQSSVIGGGYGNIISNSSAMIGSGAHNVASGKYSFIGAGAVNTNLADYALIGGGQNNRVTFGSINSFVGAGFNNTASGTSSTIAGGGNNIADANAAAVTGGSENHAGADHAHVGGGQANSSLAPYATITGGYLNSASAFGATVGGGGYDGFNIGGNNAAGAGSFIGGGIGNTIQINSLSATISGGNANSIQASAAYSTVAGGRQNTIQVGATNSVIGGGLGNVIQTNSGWSTIGGGKNNAVTDVAAFGGAPGTAPYSVIAGGEGNTIAEIYNPFGSTPPSDHSVIGGGYSNTIWGAESVIPGGQNNAVFGYWSLAAGQRAIANNSGTFVWADSQSADFTSTASDQFCIRAQGGIQLSSTTSLFCGTGLRQMLNLFGTDYGVGVQAGDEYFRSLADFCWFKGGVHNDSLNSPGTGGTELMRLDNAGNLNVKANVVANSVILTSDRNAKENLVAVDAKAVLAKVASLPITEWDFKGDSTARHIGPMAQDFHAAFGLNGTDDKHLAVVDEGGVALAAIQGLNEKVESENGVLREELNREQAQNAELKERLERLEKLMLNKRSN